MKDTNLHEFVIVQLHPSVPIRVDPVTGSIESGKHEAMSDVCETYLWKDSVSDFTTTHARTNRSNVMPGGGPYPLTGADAVVELWNSELVRGFRRPGTHHISAR